ncbi:hypothetical protein COE58_24330 [Bacillus cereus]|nr:hypothetical protein COE58_24330 [Bacillus cereus]
MKIHEKLKELRKLENLAEIICVSRQTISNWENGKSYPDIQSLLLLCEAYNISLEQLVGEDIIEMKRNVKEREMYLHSFMLLTSVILFSICITSVKHMGYYAFSLAAVSLVGITLTSYKLERLKKVLKLSNYKLIREYLKNNERRC